MFMKYSMIILTLSFGFIAPQANAAKAILNTPVSVGIPKNYIRCPDGQYYQESGGCPGGSEPTCLKAVCDKYGNCECVAVHHWDAAHPRNKH